MEQSGLVPLACEGEIIHIIQFLFSDMIKRTLDGLGLDFAIVNIPVNVTGTKVHLINQPPWDQW